MGYDALAETLATELIADMAHAFFGSRKELEEMLESYQSFVLAVREKEREVVERSGILSHLLLSPENVVAFYRAVGVNSAEFFLPSVESMDRTERETIPRRDPERKFVEWKDSIQGRMMKEGIKLLFPMTGKGKFTALVLWAYEGLRKTCHEYLNGRHYYDSDDHGEEKITPSYRGAVQLRHYLNGEIRKQNHGWSPALMLQYLQGFNPTHGAKERICGSGFSGSSDCLNEKLAYDPIDFDSLHLKEYPELPKQSEVSDRIKRFCGEVYTREKSAVTRMISTLKK